MKKILLALSLFSLSFQAQSNDLMNPETAEAQDADEATNGFIAFVSKFKALHTMAVREYVATETLFKNCADRCIALYEQLEVIKSDTDLAAQEQAQEITEKIESLGQQLIMILNEVKEVNALMYQFNATFLQESSYQELINILTTVLNKLVVAKTGLESVYEQATALQSQALALNTNHATSTQEQV